MTVEERKAIQAVLIDELHQRQHDQPTLLIDALLAGQGFQFVHHVLSARATMARNLTNMTEHLLRAMSTTTPEPREPPDSDTEEVA